MIISGTTINIDDITINGTSIKTLKSRLEAISADNAAAHNSIYRGKNLGTAITDAQLSAICNGSFDNMYIGDYWRLPVDGTTTAIIVGFSIHPFSCEFGLAPFPTGKVLNGGPSLCLWLQNRNWRFPVNDTDTTAGHLKGSKLYNETFPALLEMLEEVIPVDRIRYLADSLADSVDANGNVNHRVYENIRMFLPSAKNLGMINDTARKNSAYTLMSINTWPYALFHLLKDEYEAMHLDYTTSATNWGTRQHWANALGSHVASCGYKFMWPYVFIK